MIPWIYISNQHGSAQTSRVRVSARSRPPLPSPPLYPHFNRPSGFWPCVKSCLVGGSDKYPDTFISKILFLLLLVFCFFFDEVETRLTLQKSKKKKKDQSTRTSDRGHKSRFLSDNCLGLLETPSIPPGSLTQDQRFFLWLVLPIVQHFTWEHNWQLVYCLQPFNLL